MLPLLKSLFFFLLRARVFKIFSQVELAHGGRGQSYSHDQPRSFSSGRRGGVSKRSEYRGLFLHLINKFIDICWCGFSFYIFIHLVNRTVIVDGLPSSASWQDLKVLELYMTSVCTFFLYTTFNFTYSGSHEMGWRCLFFWCISGGWRLVTMLLISFPSI